MKKILVCLFIVMSFMIEACVNGNSSGISESGLEPETEGRDSEQEEYTEAPGYTQHELSDMEYDENGEKQVRYTEEELCIDYAAQRQEAEQQETVIGGGEVLVEESDLSYDYQIYYNDEETFYLVGENVSLYDVRTGEMIWETAETFREITQTESFTVLSVLNAENKIVICGQGVTGENGEYLYISFDKQMEVQEQGRITDFWEEDVSNIGIMKMQISADGKLLYYNDGNGLYCYDMESRQVVRLLEKSQGGGSRLISFFPLKNGEEIFFVSFSDESDSESGVFFRRCGILKTETNEVVYVGEKNLKYSSVYGGETFLVILPNLEYLDEGHIWIYDVQNCSFYETKINGSGEVGNLWLSDSREGVTYLNGRKDSEWEIRIEDLFAEKQADTGVTVRCQFMPYRVLNYEDSRNLIISCFNSDQKVYTVMKVSY